MISLSSFYQRIQTKYTLDLLISDDWVPKYQDNAVSLIKRGTKTSLIALAQFTEQETHIMFRSIIITPEKTVFQPRELHNPARDEVYRVLAGRYEAYINCETNIKEILSAVEQYKIK